ncbi:AmmeMemoRadiSam system radical SAM enzyme [Paramagnetospirillum magneticum]|uniref:Pyruvate-formate lyase-activating enzyme n=1 Tax=Paramagnetospirillum magneticum (strain ATCC 700264 / AMB-1) TaxID=342108 RepID=Q2W0Z1_PARM1|nr:AmmeMemoRadiSam system radical SAM enzyme [Paramagnetospirillum magneticum]BAE52484.1 Pyruvate-formate lyase-activating enzyme [Paramagnetospirillum magneticum AMB-1]
MFRRTKYWTKLGDGRIQCDVCPRECKLHNGQLGLCFNRAAIHDEIVLTTYGRSSGFCIDPIEKKPLNHFLPGTPILSLGSIGCNLTCKFCQNWNISKEHDNLLKTLVYESRNSHTVYTQLLSENITQNQIDAICKDSQNWDISKAREIDKLNDMADPETIARAAVQLGCRSVAFTYNDPVIFLEYAVDVAKACHALGLKTVAVTAGYIKPEARAEFYAHMDAANVDLKAFTEDFYHRLCGAHLEAVKETLVYLRHETGVWVEVTTLLIPGENDSPEEIDAQTRWMVEALGPDVPLHFSAFHPDWKMRDKDNTPPATLTRARDIALGNGLRYVYTGNVHDPAGGGTYCSGCGALLIGRDWYELSTWTLTPEGHCRHCGTPLPGRFEAAPGTWGRKRQPVRFRR